MMDLRRSMTFVALAAVMAAGAQSTSDDFNSFRQQMLQGYSSFRQGVLDDYDKFLDGVWKEYQQFKAVERDTVPKPHVAPKAPEVPERKPWTMKQPKPAAETPKPRQAEAPKPKPAVPSVSAAPVVPAAGLADFDFYGMTVSLPSV
ncbi:MAG: hypothetical protein K2L66_06430, partial [Paramuribaculum sp.]|nr:hypothetical protein [Paramuribaculum sp.]